MWRIIDIPGNAVKPAFNKIRSHPLYIGNDLAVFIVIFIQRGEYVFYNLVIENQPA